MIRSWDGKLPQVVVGAIHGAHAEHLHPRAWRVTDQGDVTDVLDSISAPGRTVPDDVSFPCVAVREGVSPGGYKGDSPAKKYVRYKFWTSVAKKQIHRFRDGKHLVLASWEAGDVSVLKALGVRPENILAVDSDPEAALAAQDKHPDVQVICADVEEVAREYRRKLLSAFLDFCSPMSAPLLDKVVGVINWGIKDRGIIGCAFLAGREKDQEILRKIQVQKEDLELLGGYHEALSDAELIAEFAPRFNHLLAPLEKPIDRKTAESMPHAVRQDMAESARSVLSAYADMNRPSAARLNVLLKHVMDKAAALQCCPLPIFTNEYVSNRRGRKGVPMLVVGGEVIRGLPGQRASGYRGTLWRAMSEHEGTDMRRYDLDEEDLRNIARQMEEAIEAKLGQDGFDVDAYVASSLNLKKGTVRAWRAHETRGTYEK